MSLASSDAKNDYEWMEKLGRGKFGAVFKCRRKGDQNLVAIKVSKLPLLRETRQIFEREIQILKSLQHPLILRFLDSFDSKRQISIVTEFVGGGELMERIIEPEFTLTERECVRFLRRILEAVAHLHTNGVLHLDLKPDNILCVGADSYDIRIVDFGLAQRIDKASPVEVCCLRGTPEFMSPERLRLEPLTAAADIWSVGVMAYMLLSGLSPFLGDSDQKTFFNIQEGALDFDDDSFQSATPHSIQFISQLLAKDPKQRPSAKTCLRHRWITMERHASVDPLSVEKHRQYLARRKWRKVKHVISAANYLKSTTKSDSDSEEGSDWTKEIHYF